MKRTSTKLFLAIALGVLLLPAASSFGGSLTGSPYKAAAATADPDDHPRITRAIHALEAARGDLQDAAHDYCGHRVAALEAVNAALSQLGAAIACQERRRSSIGAESLELEPEANTVATSPVAGERHPLIKAAVDALRVAKSDLQQAAHEYCGHRVAALEATNAALTQLGLAYRCDR